MKKRCLIIGSSGFLGSNLRRALAEEGDFEIIETDRVFLDLRQRAQVMECVAACQPDIIVNLAGISSPASEDLLGLYEVNAFGHLYILEAAAKLKYKPKVFLASSAQVYGPGVLGRALESTPLNPVSHYAISKQLAEKYGQLFADEVRTVAVRIYNTIGRGQSSQFLVPKIVSAFRERIPEIELGSIDVERDFIDVRDLNQMWRLVLLADDVVPKINFSNGDTATVSNIIARLTELTDHHVTVKSNSLLLRKNDIAYQCGDNTLLRHLGYRRMHTLDDTLLWMLG